MDEVIVKRKYQKRNSVRKEYKKNRFRAKNHTDSLLEKTAEFLDTNFTNFSLSNKIKISLEIFKRSMPTSPLIDQSKHTHITVKVEGIDANQISSPQSAVTSIQR